MPQIATNNYTRNVGNFIITGEKSINDGTFVKINGNIVITNQAEIGTHEFQLFFRPNIIHSNTSLVESQNFVTINGFPVIVDGDRAVCASTHTISIAGNEFVTITIPESE